MSTQPPASPELDPDDPVGARFPNTARIWNYHLGGKDNFSIDQRAAEAVNSMAGDMGVPSARDAAIEGRHLLQRMVDYMLAQGVRQFLDLGSGFPNMANTHQIAHRVDPDARVVYVDLDPMVSTHAAALLAAPNVITVTADLRQPEQVLGDKQIRELLDFNKPIGIMFICVLHCLWDEEDPWGVVRRFRDALAPESHLAISHMTNEAHPEGAQRLFQISQDMHFSTPLLSRSRADIMRFFEGFTVVEPGLVAPAQWRPDLDDPLRIPRERSNQGVPVLQQASLEAPEDDPGVAWHLCGIGIKD